MTDCANGDIRDLLPDLLHGRLTDGERNQVEAHLLGCADCRDELALLRQMRGALRRAPAVDVESIVAALPAYRPTVRAGSAGRRTGWRVAAAVTLLAAGGSSVLVARHGAGMRGDSVQVASGTANARPGRPSSGAAPVAGSTEPAAAVAAPRELALAGGTISDLDDSELSALIDDIGSLQAVTPVDVDNTPATSPLAPNSPSGT